MQKRELLKKLGVRKKMFEDYQKQVRRQRPACHKDNAGAKLSDRA
ncbi:MAG: hypothetical protein ACOX0T_08175 [Pelotomaculum sp.]|jgi:hypothetical protein